MITFEDARRVVSAAEEKAREMERSINIAVFDAGRNLKYFAPMEDVWLGGIEIAVDKVYTSTSFKMSHAGPGGAGAAGTAALWINTTNNSHVVILSAASRSSATGGSWASVAALRIRTSK